MVIAEIPETELSQLLLENYISERFLVKIIAFLCRHPDSRYAIESIACALDCKKLKLENALRYLVGMGVVELYKYNDAPCYALTKGLTMRNKLLKSISPYSF